MSAHVTPSSILSSTHSVLIVDDDPDIRDALTDLLEHSGYLVQATATGTEAIQKTRHHFFHAIILDLGLPDMDGLSVLRILKDVARNSAIIVLTAYVMDYKRSEALGMGALAYLTKPYKKEELQDALTKAIGETEGRAAPRTVSNSVPEIRPAHWPIGALALAILDSSPAVIMVKDLQGHYLLVNRRWESLFHRTRQEVHGKTIHDIFPSEIADALRANDVRVQETGAWLETEETVLQDDGPHTFRSLKFPLCDETGALYAVCGIATDITPRSQA